MRIGKLTITNFHKTANWPFWNWELRTGKTAHDTWLTVSCFQFEYATRKLDTKCLLYGLLALSLAVYVFCHGATFGNYYLYLFLAVYCFAKA